MKIFLFQALALTFTSTVWCAHSSDQTNIASTSTSNVKQQSRAALKPHQSIVYPFDIVDGKIVHLSSIGRKIENHVQTSPNVHKYMQPAHRWSQLRDRASELKQDLSIAHADVTFLKKRIKKATNPAHKENLQDEHERGKAAIVTATDRLNMAHSDMKILKVSNMLPDHVTKAMMATHTKVEHPPSKDEKKL